MRGKPSAFVIVLLILLLAGLAPAAPGAAGRPAAAGPLQSGDAGRGADFLVSTAAGAQRSPDVAYNPAAGEYLVVWHTYDGASAMNDVYGQRYSDEGVPLGEPIAICTVAGEQSDPAVAYNATAGEYMVVWSDFWNGMNYMLAGQRVAADGALAGDPFYVLPSLIQNRYRPDLVYDPNADHYLVVWSELAVNEVRGQLLDNAGEPLLADTLLIADEARAGQAAYNSNRQSYMVVYEQATLQDIYGQAIAGDGSLTGAAFVVSDAVDLQRDPDLAFDPTSLEYLVAWADARGAAGNGFDIYAQRIDEDGVLQGGNLALAKVDNDQFLPRVAHNPDANQYLVLWSDLRNALDTLEDLYAQRVLADGTLAEQGNFAVSVAPGSQVNPAVLYNADRHQYLAVWQDDRYAGVIGDAGDVYGLRLHWLGLPLGYEFNVTAAPVVQRNPDVAYNGTLQEYLVVWSGNHDDADVHSGDIWGQRYSTNGRPVEPPFAIYAGGHDDNWPAVAYSPLHQRYLVVWTDGNSFDVRGVVLSAQGEPLSNVFTIGDGIWPDVSYGLLDERFLVVFQHWDTDYNIYGRFVNSAGLMANPEFPIDAVVGDQINPAVVHNVIGNSFEVVWQDERRGEWDIFGREIFPDESRGPEVEISSAADDQTGPTVAWNGDDLELLVVWDDGRERASNGLDLYAQRLNQDGLLIGGNVAICTEEGDQESPYLNHISSNNKYYAGWVDSRNAVDTGDDIYGQWIDPDGSPGSIDLPLYAGPDDESSPVGVFSPEADQGLVIWADGRSGSDKVYGRFGVLDQEPPVANFTRQPTVGEAGTTFTFDARGSTDNATPPGALIVRWDWNGDGDWDTLPSLLKVVTRTVALPGLYTVTLGVWDMMLLSDTVAYPILVVTPTANTAPQAALTITPTAGPPGTAFTLDATASTDAEDPGALQARYDLNNDGAWETGWGVLTWSFDWVNTAGDYTARVEVRDPEGLTDAAIYNYRVEPGPIVDLDVDPFMPMVRPGGEIQYYATAWDEHGNEISCPAVTWSVLDPDAGTIDADGLFTAGSQVESFADAVQAESTNGVTATASVIIYQTTTMVYVPLVLKNDTGPAVETELAHDDGTLDSTDSYDVGGGFANCFSPPGGSATIQRVRLYVQLPSMPVEMHVWDAATHADLLPSPYQGNPYQDGWNDIDLAPFDLTVSDDFCVGFLYLTGYQPTLGVDTSAPLANQSFEIDGDYWELQTYDAMIRVVVTQP